MFRLRGLAVLLVSLAAFVYPARADEVKVYQAPLVIPTYKIGPPEEMPMFSRDIYPYTMYDKLGSEKVDQTYNALYAENEYVKALVLPQIGGRLHGAMDKTNGYQFLYNQVTIKPGLVGMAGAWISGGVEWNFPHGHRPSGFRDTDWRLQENPDGSKTVWTGEVDRVYGMRWSVGTTVHPGRNWVETKIRLYNCTPYAHSFQYWATAAVRTTYEYQAVIPGEIATGHYKHEFYHWPVNEGVDISYWKNIAPASSFFAWDSKFDYFGGYSPEMKAGMVHVADHNIVRGKKLWTWGTAPSGRIWEKILTDGDLPYFEPQAGGYSDNQPDYHWILPGETKVFSHYWFPVRDIGVWDYANLEGALNIELEKGAAKIGWSPTGKNVGAKVYLSAKGVEIYSKTVTTDPATPFIDQAKAPKDADLYDLTMTVVAANGDTLLSYAHPRPTHPPLPTPAPPPPSPAETKSGDELFTLGDRAEMFRNPEVALGYYEEALKRDPGDVRTNSALGLLDLKHGQYEEAIKHFDKSIDRDPEFYTAWYYRGLCHLRLGQAEDAEYDLNRSSYQFTWYAAAHFELAQLAASQGRLKKALEHIDRSIQGNADNAQAYAVKALILNGLGRYKEALEVADGIQKVDPLDFLSMAEKTLALSNLGRSEEVGEMRDTIMQVLRGEPENFIELANRFARCGQFKEAGMVLSFLPDRTNPLALYYEAWFDHMAGNDSKAASLCQAAGKAPLKYVFSSRPEALPVLGWALEQNGQDGHALYLLGDLYYDFKRTDEAIDAWRNAVKAEPGNAVAWRNLGYALNDNKAYTEARDAYQSAIQADPSAGQALLELDGVNKKLGLSPEDRMAIFESHLPAVEESDPLLTQLISLFVQKGRYEEALKYLTTHHFHSWEGRYGIHQYWVESNLMRGDAAYGKGDYKTALASYQAALEYPENLEVAAQPRSINARKNYKVGLALAALKKNADARKVFQQVAAEKPGPDDPNQYYRGLALEKLGQKAESKKVFEDFLAVLQKRGPDLEAQVDEGINFDPGRNANAIQHYKLSLAYEALGDKDKAQAELQKAQSMDPIVALRAFSPRRAGW